MGSGGQGKQQQRRQRGGRAGWADRGWWRRACTQPEKQASKWIKQKDRVRVRAMLLRTIVGCVGAGASREAGVAKAG